MTASLLAKPAQYCLRRAAKTLQSASCEYECSHLTSWHETPVSVADDQSCQLHSAHNLVGGGARDTGCRSNVSHDRCMALGKFPNQVPKEA